MQHHAADVIYALNPVHLPVIKSGSSKAMVLLGSRDCNLKSYPTLIKVIMCILDSASQW